MNNSTVYVTFTSLPFGWVLAAFAIAALMCFFASPFARRLAILIGAIDVPTDDRRVHRKPIPRMGGLAIFIAFATATLCFYPYLDRSYFGFLAGGAVLVTGGIIDDKYNLRPMKKFAFQLVASGVAVASGVRIDVLNNILVFSSKEYLSLGWLSVPITMGWIILLINAVNLIDGLDGLAAGVASISSLTLLIIAVLLNDAPSAILTAALAGACIGFLPYNFNPASIFMGETGASFIGYVLACASVAGLFKMYAVVSVAVPIIILGLPIFEIIFSAVRRILKGQSPVHADKKHIHHRLLALGLSQKQSVAFIYGVCVILGAVAVLFVLGRERIALLVITAAVVIGVGFALWRINATPLALYRKIKWWLIGLHDPEAAEEAAEAAKADEIGKRTRKHLKPKGKDAPPPESDETAPESDETAPESDAAETETPPEPDETVPETEEAAPADSVIYNKEENGEE